MIVALSSCSVAHPTLPSTTPPPTPIPERPFSEMSPQPAMGVAGADSIGDAYLPTLGNIGYDVQQYSIDMLFSDKIDAITATVTISTLVTLDNLGRFSLDFAGYQVDGVQAGDQYVAYYRSPDKLYIDLPKALSTGNKLVMTVSYHGSLETYTSPNMPVSALGLRTFPGNNLTYAFAEPNGAHAWFPCNDHPLDKAAYRFKLTVPKGLTAVANGTLLQTIPSDNQVTFIWSESSPMASYLATVVVGNYQRIDAAPVGDVQVRHYVIQGDFDYSDQLRYTQDMLEYYSNLIDPYPFSEFGFIIIRTNENEPSFAEESQTIVMVDRGYLLDTQGVGVLAHELVHQWFGDDVSVANWNEVWLKEGMANYLMVMWLDDRDFVSLSELMAELENVLVTHASELNYPLNQPPTNHMYGANSYDKGAWVFHMLRQEIGDENFTRFLQAYYQRYAGSTASTAELQKVAEEVSGTDLGIFFQQWVYGAGIPQLAVTWTEQPGTLAIQVCQSTSGQVYNLPLEVSLQGIDGTSEQQVIPLDEQQEQVTYSVHNSVTELVVDPAQNLLADISVDHVDALSGCNP
jgi:aminopeptidase N